MQENMWGLYFHLACLFYTMSQLACLLLRISPGGGTWVLFGWVCAAWDSKLAPRYKKTSPKIDTPFSVLEMGQFFIPHSRICPKTDTLFWKWANFLYSVLESLLIEIALFF